MDHLPNIVLTAAQMNHIARLLAARSQAEQALQQFMDYLYAEYNVSPADYPMVDGTLGLVAERKT